MTATFVKLSASCYSKVMSTSAELLWGSVLFSSGVLWELPGVAPSHVAVGQDKHVNTSHTHTHTPPSTHSAHPDKAHTDRRTVSPPVYFHCPSLPPLSPSCHCITEVKKKEKEESLISLHIPLHESQIIFFFHCCLYEGSAPETNKNNMCHFLFPPNLHVTAAQFGAGLFIADYRHCHPAAWKSHRERFLGGESLGSSVSAKHCGDIATNKVSPLWSHTASFPTLQP